MSCNEFFTCLHTCISPGQDVALNYAFLRNLFVFQLVMVLFYLCSAAVKFTDFGFKRCGGKRVINEL